MRTGPNDIRRVVWAIGEFFKYFFRIFCTNDFFLVHTAVIYEVRDREDGYDENGPIGNFFSFLLCFFNTNYFL